MYYEFCIINFIEKAPLRSDPTFQILPGCHDFCGIKANGDGLTVTPEVLKLNRQVWFYITLTFGIM